MRPQGVAGVRAAIVARNYAEAEGWAAPRRWPTPNPSAQFELARAEAMMGNQGLAMDALEAAVQAGLRCGARGGRPCLCGAGPERAAGRASPQAVAAWAPRSAGSGADQVQIRQNGQGTEIQAGDVHLKTDFEDIIL
jgi:hypothetical protein